MSTVSRVTALMLWTGSCDASTRIPTRLRRSLLPASARRRVLFVEVAHDFVEPRLLTFERDRHVEERFGRDCEELRGAGRTVRLERWPLDAGPQCVVRLGAYLYPPLEVAATGQPWGAVDDVVSHVDLVRELVVHDVLSASGISSRVLGLVPGQQHRTAAVMRL